MGGFDEGKKRFPNEKEMATIVRQLQEAVDAGAAGWSAQRLVPESRVSVQRDYDGTPMITDILPDEFYLALAKALGEKGEGCIQFTQSGATQSKLGVEDDFRFLEKLAEVSGRPLLYNAILVSDKHPESHLTQLKWVAEANARGTRVFGQSVTARAPVRTFWSAALRSTIIGLRCPTISPPCGRLYRRRRSRSAFPGAHKGSKGDSHAFHGVRRIATCMDVGTMLYLLAHISTWLPRREGTSPYGAWR